MQDRRDREDVGERVYQRGRLDGGEASLVFVVVGLAAPAGRRRPQLCTLLTVQAVLPVILLLLTHTHTHTITYERYIAS